MSEITILGQIAKVRNFEKGHRATQVINTGFSSGILDTLAQSIEGLTVPELALKLMLYEPFLKIWCQTAYHFEILDCDEQGRFKLQAFLDEVLGLDLSFRPNPRKKRPAHLQTQFNGTMIRSWIHSDRQTRLYDQITGDFFVAGRATRSISTIFHSMIFPERGI